MLRGGRRRAALCSQQLRGIAVSAVQQALPVPVQDEQQSGWLATLFGAGKRGDVPLSEPLPGVQLPTPYSPPSSPPATQTSKLSNGLVIAAEATPGPTATLGLYVNAGSSYEGTGQTGVAHLLEYMAFKATQHRTHFRLVREAEAIGANTLASASREQMVYSMDVVKTNIPEALELLADAVFNPKFLPWEVKEQRAKLQEDIKNIKSKPQAALLEGLHEVAWTGGLSRPLICPSDAANGLNSQALAEFHQAHYVPGKIVLAGTGVSQEELSSLAKPILEGIPGGKVPGPPPSSYVGGDFRQFMVGDTTQVMIAFELQGGWKDVKTAVSATVLQFLLGGGGSFSSGGPGKGMHSRLYRRVLNKHAWMQNCTAFNSLYDTTGVAGISAIMESKSVAKGIDTLSQEMLAVAKDVPGEEVERAKSAAVSAILMNLESRAVTNEDIGRQILTYGHRKPVKEFVDLIRAVKPSDISGLVSKMVKTPLSMAILGDISSAPRYNAVQAHFG